MAACATKPIRSAWIAQALHMARSMSDDGDVQLSILGHAFVTGCLACDVDKVDVMQALSEMYDEHAMLERGTIN